MKLQHIIQSEKVDTTFALLSINPTSKKAFLKYYATKEDGIKEIDYYSKGMTPIIEQANKICSYYDVTLWNY